MKRNFLPNLTPELIDVRGIMGRRPHAHAWLEEPRPNIIEAVRLWILANCAFTRRVRRDGVSFPLSSYGWKHAAESRSIGIGAYVSNGEFILAALAAGAIAQPLRRGSINAVFNLKLIRRKERAAE